jgi:hypothetical protein
VIPAGRNAASTARATRTAVRNSAPASSSSRSTMVSTWRLVATITWPGLTWPASMKAIVCSSS